ncbi:MAG: hypothetical protein AAGA66_02350 [Bacteroidota bacterium]
MSELLTALPKKEDLNAALPSSFETGGIDELGTDVNALGAGIDGGIPAIDTAPNLETAVPADLSPESVTSRLKEPIDALSAVSADGISASIRTSPIDVGVTAPSFDIHAPMNTISNALAPSGQIVTPSIEESIPGFESDAAIQQIKQLAATGKATPMKLVNMYLKVFKTMIEKATDKERIVELAIESLEEIYLGQIEKLQYNLPYKVLEDMVTLMGSDFLEQYRQLLEDLEQSTTIDFNLLLRARNEIIPTLVDIKRTRQTLTNFSNASIEDLQNAIDHVLEFTGEGQVVLQTFFDSFESKIMEVLDAVEPPLEEIKNLSAQIIGFLNDTAGKAEEAAIKVKETLTDQLNGLEDLISTDLKDKIEDINQKIESFLAEIGEKADVAVGGVKNGLSSVTDGVEQFFERVNALKAQLEKAVEDLATKTDEKTEEAFKQAEQKIRQLLGKITDVLESPSVKDALDKTKEGIDKFKKVMEEVSLQPVFDLVVTKAGDLEVKVRAIQVDELGVPQKTALKLGAKIIQEVEVDEIIKPELIAIFKELRDPIAALVEELKKGVLQINELIEEFAPGTIVRGLIEQAGPYKDFLKLLDTHKPSSLLQPIKTATDKLTDLVAQLDPNILIAKIQGLFDELSKLASTLSPEKLNTMIMSAVGKATNELRSIRDVKLDEIMQTIKDTISLEKLLESTGLGDIANAEIWDHINYYLDGVFLDKITEALTYLEAELPARIVGISFEHHEEEVARMNAHVADQIKCTAAQMKSSLSNVHALLVSNQEVIEELETKRQQLLVDLGDVPEYQAILTRMSLEDLTEMEELVDTIQKMPNVAINSRLKLFADLLKAHEEQLKKVDRVSLELAVPFIVKTQLTDPINRIVQAIRDRLEDYKEVVDAIKAVIEKLVALPVEMDANVALVLDAAVQEIKDVISATMTAINTAAGTLTAALKSSHDALILNLDKFSPTGLLNAFAASDFEENGLEAFRTILSSPPHNDDIAVFLSTKLTPQQIQLLEVAGTNAEKTVLEAFNAALFDPKLNDHKSLAQATINQKLAELVSSEEANPITQGRYESLATQLDDMGMPNRKYDKIRLNRIILEAMYPEQIKMSIQSLHPFIVAQIARLYPQGLVNRLDSTYAGIVDKIKRMPKELIQEPLDDQYNVLKEQFQEHFDIEGIFKVLQVKLDGLDDDLELGLNRISFAFDQLVETFDTRLAE